MKCAILGITFFSTIQVSVTIPAAMVFPPVRNMNLPNSFELEYKSRHTGVSVVISTIALFPLVNNRGFFVLSATSPVALSKSPISFFTEAAA